MVALVLLPLMVDAGPRGEISVIDTDTWDVGGARVRLFGIDAPEQDQTCTRKGGAVWPCGAWATDQTRALYQSRSASCQQIDRDRYGRIVARCTVDENDVAGDLVDRGLALAFRTYSQDYVANEARAAIAAIGLHASRVETPADFRARKAKGARRQDPACGIKGNISASGVRIYHVPGQQHYARTRIDPTKGERWFCSQSEAQAAGWRAAIR